MIIQLIEEIRELLHCPALTSEERVNLAKILIDLELEQIKYDREDLNEIFHAVFESPVDLI